MAQANCAVFNRLLAKHGTIPAEQAGVASLLLLDHHDFAPLAVLTLLRHAAHGDCGALRVLEADLAPERFDAAEPRARGSALSVLPALCSPHADTITSRLLDRCHVHAAALTFGADVRGCLGALVQAAASEEESVADRLLLAALGAEKRSTAVAQRASTLLRLGLERSLQDALTRDSSGAAEPAASVRVVARRPCCTARPCGPAASAEAASTASAEAEAVGEAAGGQAGVSAPLLPLHPLPFPLAEVPSGEPGATRSRTSLVAQAAAPLLGKDHPLPATFDRRWRSPCWACNLSHGLGRSLSRGASRRAAPLCCLPALHILGVSKCGTTDLYARLSHHPLVLPSANKGPHFFDEPHSWEWYLTIYARGAAALLDGSADPRAVMIDASSNTFTYSGIGVRATLAPRALLPQVLAWLQPSLRMVVMLREPAQRASAANQYSS